MGYTTITTGTVISSTWGNEVRDQLVTPFASSATRDATISLANRENGQTVALTPADSTHGLTIWNGSSWTRSWNMPWGLMGVATATAQQSITATTSADVTEIALPSAQYTATRYYQAHISLMLTQSAGTAVTTDFYLTNGAGTVIATLPRLLVGATANEAYTTQAVFTTSTVGQVVKLRYKQSGANSVIMNGTSASNCQIVVLDIGPSGAPA